MLELFPFREIGKQSKFKKRDTCKISSEASKSCPRHPEAHTNARGFSVTFAPLRFTQVRFTFSVHGPGALHSTSLNAWHSRTVVYEASVRANCWPKHIRAPPLKGYCDSVSNGPQKAVLDIVSNSGSEVVY